MTHAKALKSKFQAGFDLTTQHWWFLMGKQTCQTRYHTLFQVHLATDGLKEKSVLDEKVHLDKGVTLKHT